MAVKRDIAGADRVVAAYNGVLAIVWGSLAGSSQAAIPAAVAHCAAAALPWLLAGRASPDVAVSAPPGRGDRAARAWHALRNLYPLVALIVFWIELGPLIQALARPAFDPWVLGLDEGVFGVHLQAVWQPHMSNAALGEVMHFFYVAYYPLIFLPPLIAFAQGRADATRDIMFRLILAYLFCYLVYIAVPTYGPRYQAGGFDPALGGVFRGAVEWAHGLGDSKGTAFPSSHVVGAVTIAFLGWRWFGRTAAWLLTVQAGGVVLSTVYTQNHYAIDSLAGLLGALALQLAVVPVALAMSRAGGEQQAAPVFPDFERILGSSRTDRPPVPRHLIDLLGPDTAGS